VSVVQSLFHRARKREVLWAAIYPLVWLVTGFADGVAWLFDKVRP
jgi:hypothetical protein